MRVREPEIKRTVCVRVRGLYKSYQKHSAWGGGMCLWGSLRHWLVLRRMECSCWKFSAYHEFVKSQA